MSLTPIIGLEIHVQLKTKSKMFCSCDNDGEQKPANTTVCPVCMGHPGTLPVANRQAIAWSVLASAAINCTINQHSKFDRKSYFYPDLPKGYQISQYDQPIGINGYLVIDTPNGPRRIGITRLHLEEDAAKNFHAADGKHTLVDYNRAGTPLMEIVSEPDIRTPQEAKLFVQELRSIMRYLGVSTADMEKGHLRCDANISLTDTMNADGTAGKLYPKTEIKNINSFKAVERALEYEIKRQTKLWESGAAPTIQSTRGWDENKGITEEQRTKEEAHDYRYFPEPDLPPLHFDADTADALAVAKIIATMPELPQARRKRFVEELGLTIENARILTDDKALANFFEQCMSELRGWLVSLGETEGTDDEQWEAHKAKLAKLVTNWLVNKLLALINKDGKAFDEVDTVTPENFAEFISLLHQNKVNSTVAQKILELMYQTGKDPSVVIQEEDLSGGTDSNELEKIVTDILTTNPEQVAQYKGGKTTVLQFFIGQAMRATKGKAQPDQLKEILISKLS